jgi:outer membrane protein OmpA-like peptidoglycan-associated protein
MPLAVLGFSVGIMAGGALLALPAQAEEYMKRGASVDDYQQALGRVLERKRGIVTARERQQQAAARAPAGPTPRSTSSGSSAVAKVPRAVVDTSVHAPDPSEQGVASDGVSLYFGYDSAALTDAARDALRKLGQALQAPEFASVYWLVEGHTDATGGADYNQRLSEERAVSARRFLIDSAGVAPERLITLGKGESELYDASRPAASVNRRVRLRPIGEDNASTEPTELTEPTPGATATAPEDAG